MKGAIEYLRAVRSYCEEYKGDCKACPLGDEPRVEDNLCPRVVHPSKWNDMAIAQMVRIGKVE